MSKPVKRRSPVHRQTELPEALAKGLDWLVDATLKGAGKLPPGYHRSNIKTMLRAMARRSFDAYGPDLPPDTFINSSS